MCRSFPLPAFPADTFPAHTSPRHRRAHTQTEEPPPTSTRRPQAAELAGVEYSPKAACGRLNDPLRAGGCGGSYAAGECRFCSDEGADCNTRSCRRPPRKGGLPPGLTLARRVCRHDIAGMGWRLTAADSATMYYAAAHPTRRARRGTQAVRGAQAGACGRGIH